MSKKKGKKNTQKAKKQPEVLSNSAKYEEDDRVRQIVQQAKRDAYPNMSEDCKLPLSKTPSPLNCSGCEIDCPYNRHY